MKPRAVPAPIATLLLAAALVPTARAQSSDEELRREIEALKQGQKEILEQLEAIRKQLRARAAPAAPAAAASNVRDRIFDLGANPVRGAPTAGLTLVEFTDYQ